MSHLKRVCVALLILTGCGQSASDVRHGCEEAVARYHHPTPAAETALAEWLKMPDVPPGRHDYARAVAARAARQQERLGELLLERCTADRWNAEMRACIAADGTGCPDKLPPAQLAAFDQAFTALNAQLVAETKADRDPWNPGLRTTCGSAAESIRRAVGPLPEEAGRTLHNAAMMACLKWHYSAVNCFGDAGTPAALKACERYLTPEDRTDLHLALAPDPG